MHRQSVYTISITYYNLQMYCQDGWSLITGTIVSKPRTFIQECMVFEDRWYHMEVVSQDRFHSMGFLSS